MSDGPVKDRVEPIDVASGIEFGEERVSGKDVRFLEFKIQIEK